MKPQASVYLDANVLIYWVEGTSSLRDTVARRLHGLKTSGASLCTSELSMAEVLVHPLRAENDALTAVYDELFRSYVRPLPVSRSVLRLAAQLRAQTLSRRLPDAIHIATAILSKADDFMTGDKGIKNLPAPLRLIAI